MRFRLFPTDLFELFIDVGHYVRDLAAYEGLQSKVSLYTVRKQLVEGFSVCTALVSKIKRNITVFWEE